VPFKCPFTLSVSTYKAARLAVIRIYDAARNVIETHEHKGDFKEW